MSVNHRRLIFESAPTHSEETPEPTPLQRSKAEELVGRANRAEANLATATHQDLEALAALAFPLGSCR